MKIQMTATYYLVTPTGVSAHRTAACAGRRAMTAECNARRWYGEGAGADCHLVESTQAGLVYRGLVIDRTGRTIGDGSAGGVQFGCAAGVVAKVARAAGA